MSVLITPLFFQTAIYGIIAVTIYGLLRLFYLVVIYPNHVSPLCDLPGPKDHHFFLGQLLNQFRAADPEQPYTKWMQEWPDAPLIRYRETGWAAEGLLINSAAAYRDVMHSHSCYAYQRSAPFRRLIGDIIGVGLVFAEGSEHCAQRKALGGLFTVANIKSYLPLLREKANRLVDEMSKADDGLVEMKQLYAKITLDVVGIFVLGEDLHNFECRTEFQTCYESMFDLSTAGMLLAAVNLAVPIRWIPLQANREFMDASKRLRQILTDMTEERIAAVEAKMGKQSSPTPIDLLTYMVETKYLAKIPGDRWTKQELIEQVLNFMATGHETTAGALTFATHQLGLCPDVVAKLRQEATSLPGSPSFSDIESLPYLDAVMKECLRLNPPVAGIPRVAQTDTVVAGHFIPRGTTLMPVPAVIHRNPALWGHDVEQFRPQRWIDDPATGGAVHKEVYAWIAFGHGPRACIGRALAALNFKVVVLALVRNFELDSLDRGKLPVVNPSGQLRPKGEVWLRVTKVEEKV